MNDEYLLTVVKFLFTRILVLFCTFKKKNKSQATLVRVLSLYLNFSTDIVVEYYQSSISNSIYTNQSTLF